MTNIPWNTTGKDGLGQPQDSDTETLDHMELRILARKWANHFAKNGTAYFEHTQKDDEFVQELIAVVTQEKQKAYNEGCVIGEKYAESSLLDELEEKTLEAANDWMLNDGRPKHLIIDLEEVFYAKRKALKGEDKQWMSF